MSIPALCGEIEMWKSAFLFFCDYTLVWLYSGLLILRVCVFFLISFRGRQGFEGHVLEHFWIQCAFYELSWCDPNTDWWCFLSAETFHIKCFLSCFVASIDDLGTSVPIWCTSFSSGTIRTLSSSLEFRSLTAPSLSENCCPPAR